MKRTPLKRISDKMKKQLVQERKLKLEMLEECGNRCQVCNVSGNFVVLDKHEIVSRARGGSPLDKGNCIILCRICHDKATSGELKPEYFFEIKGAI
jgi:hypothetical protein